MQTIDRNRDGRADTVQVAVEPGQAPKDCTLHSFRGELFAHVGSDARRPRSLAQLVREDDEVSILQGRIKLWLPIGILLAFAAGWLLRDRTFSVPLAAPPPPLPAAKVADEVEKAVRSAPDSWIAGLYAHEQRLLLDALIAERKARKEWEAKAKEGTRDAPPPR